MTTMRRVFFMFLMLAFAQHAFAHDTWINHNGYKNKAGEWCCGVGDCGVIVDAKHAVKEVSGGYMVTGWVEYGRGVTGNPQDGAPTFDFVNEFVPYKDAQPSPDGAYWRCKNASTGKRRCFFAPPPQT